MVLAIQNSIYEVFNSSATLQLSDSLVPTVIGTCKTKRFCCGQDIKIKLLPVSVLFADSKLCLLAIRL